MKKISMSIAVLVLALGSASMLRAATQIGANSAWSEAADAASGIQNEIAAQKEKSITPESAKGGHYVRGSAAPTISAMMVINETKIGELKKSSQMTAGVVVGNSTRRFNYCSGIYHSCFQACGNDSDCTYGCQNDFDQCILQDDDGDR